MSLSFSLKKKQICTNLTLCAYLTHADWPRWDLGLFYINKQTVPLILNVYDEKSLRRILKSKSCLIIICQIIEQLSFIKWYLKIVSNSRIHPLNFFLPNTSTLKLFNSYWLLNSSSYLIITYCSKYRNKMTSFSFLKS